MLSATQPCLVKSSRVCVCDVVANERVCLFECVSDCLCVCVFCMCVTCGRLATPRFVEHQQTPLHTPVNASMVTMKKRSKETNTEYRENHRV